MTAEDRVKRALSEDRYKWQDPHRIVADLPEIHGYVLEPGCGPGFFTIPIAERLVGNGIIDSLDIDREMINALYSRMKEIDAKVAAVIKPRVADVESLYFPDKSFDTIFLANVLHDFRDPRHFLIKSRRYVRDEGFFINIDWSTESPDKGPPVSIRFSEEKSIDLFERSGFELVRKIYGGEYHYGHVFKT